MGLRKRSIKSISISDLHIGHYKVPPENILNNLRTYLYPHLNATLDLLFIIGDVFHTLLNLNSTAAYVAMTFIQEVLELSLQYGFKIRVVKGTFEHDRDQNKYFALSQDKYPSVKVMDTMCIEHIEGLDIHVLYIPDDLPYNHAQAEAVRKIKELGLSKVDIIALHGYCKHEIPPNVPIQPYNLFDSEVLQKYASFIIKGHIHVKSVHKTTINNGSFERGNHGEEGSKGFFIIDLEPDGKFTYKFVENEGTLLFKTITVPNENIIESFKTKIEKVIKSLKPSTPKPIHVRILSDRATRSQFNPYDFDFGHQFRFDFKLLDDDIVVLAGQESLAVLEELPKITRDNLSSLLSEHMDKKLTADCIEQILKQEE